MRNQIKQKIIVFNGGSKLSQKFELYSELIDSYEPISDDFISIPSDPKQNECLILSTSGCFSRPKAVSFTHYSVVSALEITSYPTIFGYTQSEVVSAHTELSHQMAVFQIFTAISTGSKFALMPTFERKDFVNYVKKYRISAALLTAQSIISLLKSAEDTPNFATQMKSLVKIISCGSVLTKTFSKQFIDVFKHIKDLRQGLFQTECMTPITLMVKGTTDFESIGVPTPNTTVIIKEWQSGDQLGANQIGEICVRREDSLYKRYLNHNDSTEALFDTNGWLHTRILGYYDEDRLLYIVGSIEEMIRSENTLISPTELESFLLSHNSVSEAAVIGVSDQSLGQLAIGFVILKHNSKALETEILDFVNSLVICLVYNLTSILTICFAFDLIFSVQLPKKKKLNGVYVMKYLPKTICGKISKRQLKEEFCFKIIKQKF